MGTINQDVSDAKLSWEFKKLGLDLCKLSEWLFLVNFCKTPILEKKHKLIIPGVVHGDYQPRRF